MARRSSCFVALLALGLGGCPEPHTKFDEFVARTPIADAAVVDGGPSALHDVTGRFLLAIATTLAPDEPLQFITESVLTMNGNGEGTLSLSNQALTVVGRIPIGSLIVSNGNAVNANGQFMAPFGSVMVPAAANPVTNGDITATLTLIGTTVSDDRFCGSIAGMVTAPIPLDLVGSKWGAIRVPSGAIGSALPAPDVSCPASSVPIDGGLSDGANGDGARFGG